MEGFIAIAARLVRAGQRAYVRKRDFLCIFALVLLLSIAALAELDLLPSVAVAKGALSAPSTTNQVVVALSVPSSPELPTKITISAIGLSAAIANPTTTDVGVLDQYLLRGAVRYPTSALLGETGNVVLFGHSSYLPIVGNQAYKTFDGIQKLKAGDDVVVSSSDAAYTYRVRSVTKESANDAAIPLSVSGEELTLSTCDSFAEKTDRFVVVADFVESHPSSS